MRALFTSIVIPNGVTTIGSNTFQSTKIQTLVLPATLTSVGGAAFHSVSTIQTLVFANTSFDGWSTNVTFNGVNPNIIFFAGENPATLTTHYTQWASYSTMSYATYLKNPSNVGAKTIVYGTKNCTNCSNVVGNETTFKFTDYMSPMYDVVKCACGAETEKNTYAPMFSGYMISTPEDGRAAVCVTYSLNASSVAKYEEEMNTEISYGVIAAGKANLGGNAPLDENGNATTLDKGVVIKAEMSKGYASYDFKITGAESLTEAVDVIIATYVTEEGKGYVYLQNGVVNNLDFASITIQPNA